MFMSVEYSAVRAHHQQHARRSTKATSELIDQLAPPGQPQVALLRDLGVIVAEADPAVSPPALNMRDPHVGIAQVRPQQRRNHDRDDDQDAAHGRRAGLLLVRFRTFLADVLADLKLAQLGDQPRTQRDAQEQRRQAGKRRAKRGVAEDAERADVWEKLFVEKVIKHSLPPPANASTLSSARSTLHAARTLEQHRVARAQHAAAAKSPACSRILEKVRGACRQSRAARPPRP